MQSEMKASDWYYRVWQSSRRAFCGALGRRDGPINALTKTRLCFGSFESQDGMTPNWVRLPYEFARPDFVAHQQRSQRRQPCLLRHLEPKPPSTNRVGMTQF